MIGSIVITPLLLAFNLFYGWFSQIYMQNIKTMQNFRNNRTISAIKNAIKEDFFTISIKSVILIVA